MDPSGNLLMLAIKSIGRLERSRLGPCLTARPMALRTKPFANDSAINSQSASTLTAAPGLSTREIQFPMVPGLRNCTSSRVEYYVLPATSGLTPDRKLLPAPSKNADSPRILIESCEYISPLAGCSRIRP